MLVEEVFDMDPDQLRELEGRMQAMDDRDLLRLVAFEKAQYRPEAVQVAEEEILRRRLRVLSAEEYWKAFPQDEIGPTGFCSACVAETSDESPGSTRTVHLIGTRLLGSDEECSACGSVVKTKYLCIIGPVLPLGRYRVRYLKRGVLSRQYVGRKLKQPGE